MPIELDVSQIVEAARAEVNTAIIEDVKRRLSWTVGNELAEQIAPVVKTFVQTEIVPELSAMLFEQKGVILEAATQAAVVIGQGVAEKLVKQAADAMNNGYSRNRIIEAILGK